MPMLKTHLKAGVFVFPVYFFVFDLVHANILNSWYDPSLKALIISYVFFVLGSDLPDIDSPNAPVRWFTQSLFPVIFLSAFYELGILRSKLEFLGGYKIPVLVAGLVVLGFSAGYILDLLKHRGFLHTNVFGVIYAAVCYILGRWGFSLKGTDLVFVFLSGFFGVWTHLLLDYKLSAFVRWLSRKS